MSLRAQLLLTLLFLIGVQAIFEMTPLDLWVQNHFYDPAAIHVSALERWVVYKHNATLEFWFHKSAKKALEWMGICLAICFIASFRFKRLRSYRYHCLFLISAISLLTISVGVAKHITNTYCPNQTTPYGGDKPYVKLLESYPEGFSDHKKGRCFPAGHATIGFGLMALYFLFENRRARLAGLALGLTLGWVLGIFQMLRGEHFLSHTLFTMTFSWFIILLNVACYQAFKRRRHDYLTSHKAKC